MAQQTRCWVWSTRLTGVAAGMLLAARVSLPGTPPGRDASLAGVVQRLERGERVRIVCFGDSITGRYYHTGSRIAYPALVEQGLRRLYPKAQVDVVNAGISGNTTVAGLKRMDRDVLRHKPHLVVVMYGMNDVCGNRPEQFAANLRTIIKRSLAAGAAVMLCTQNNTYPAGPRRPPERLARYTQTIRDVGAETGVPVADCCAAYEAIQERDRMAWVMLMSETIHPNLNGHRVFAQTIVERFAGKRLPLDAFTNSRPAIPCTLAQLRAAGDPLQVVAAGLDPQICADAVRKAFPDARVTAAARAVDEPTVAALAKRSPKLLASGGEHLLAIALPAEPLSLDPEAYKRQVFRVVRYSVRFGYHPRARDVVWVLPSVLEPNRPPAVRKREHDMAALAHSHDIGAISRPEGNTQPAADVIALWLREQAAARP